MKALALALAALAGPAFASSGDAWAEFRAEVEAACRALVQDPGTLQVEVNGFGSPSYGVALLSLKADAGTDRMVCIYDKATGKAELTAPFDE